MRVTLAVAALCGCGPQVGDADSRGSGDGTSSQNTTGGSTGLATTSSSSSELADDSTTGALVPGCGNGVFEDGEWCFERHAVSAAADQGEPYRVLAGGEGEPGFSLWAWSGFYQVHWDGAQLSVSTESYYAIGQYHRPDSVVYRVKLIVADEGRVDLLHYSARAGFCSIASGPFRTPFEGPGAPAAQFIGLDCAHGNLLFPIRIPGLQTDAFFFSEPFRERSILHYAQFPAEESLADWQGTEQLQWLEAPAPCGVVLGHAANVRGDDREEALLLADECTDDGQYGLFAHVLDDEQRLGDAPIRLGDLSLPLPPLSWTILPGSDGGYARIVVAGPGYTTLLSFDGAGPLTASDLGVEALPLQFADDDGPAERIPLGHGVFEPHGSTAVSVNVEDGIQIVALDGRTLGLFDEEALSYAVSDLNGDGWADLAALVDDQVVVHLSNP